MVDFLEKLLGLGMLRVGLEDALDRGLGGVAPARGQLGLGKLDLEVVGLLGL